MLPKLLVITRKRLIYLIIFGIVILLFYMESSLLSINWRTPDEEMIIDKEMMYDKKSITILIKPNNTVTYSNNFSKSQLLQHVQTTKIHSSPIISPIAPTPNINIDINNDTVIKTNIKPTKKPDVEQLWFQNITYWDAHNIFNNVSWHLLDDNRISSMISNANIQYKASDFIINELHPLHPNMDIIELLPMPQHFLLYKYNVLIRGKRLKFKCNMIGNEVIQFAINKYLSLMFDHNIDDDMDDIDVYYYTTVEINIENTSVTRLHRYLDTNESYSLYLPCSNCSNCSIISISSSTIFGAIHAIETLSQLVFYDFILNKYFIKYCGIIYDYPFYKYRGVLLDTSRHFYSKQAIKDLIDSIIYTKFNVFHWHIVDDQSWPYPLKIYPQLIKNSSWSKMERYSINDVKEIINYANLRGVRVIPEFDSPAHVYSLCRVFDICMDEFCTTASNGLLNPTKNGSLEIIYNIYREITSTFLDEYIHIGHDEADYKKCFKTNKKLKQFAQKHSPKNVKLKSKKELGIYYYYFNKTYNFVKNSLNRSIIVWDDVWFRLRKKYILPNDIILIFWRSAWKAKLEEMMTMNYTVIMSEPFYIDLLHTPLYRRYYWDIFMVTQNKPHAEWWRKQILGGQACIWSERIDMSVLYSKLFPDLDAISENLWLGGPNVKYQSWNITKKRLKWHRCLLLKRGIPAGIIDEDRQNVSLYGRQPNKPGSCYEQR